MYSCIVKMNDLELCSSNWKHLKDAIEYAQRMPGILRITHQGKTVWNRNKQVLSVTYSVYKNGKRMHKETLKHSDDDSTLDVLKRIQTSRRCRIIDVWEGVTVRFDTKEWFMYHNTQWKRLEVVV